MDALSLGKGCNNPSESHWAHRRPPCCEDLHKDTAWFQLDLHTSAGLTPGSHYWVLRKDANSSDTKKARHENKVFVWKTTLNIAQAHISMYEIHEQTTIYTCEARRSPLYRSTALDGQHRAQPSHAPRALHHTRSITAADLGAARAWGQAKKQGYESNPGSQSPFLSPCSCYLSPTTPTTAPVTTWHGPDLVWPHSAWGSQGDEGCKAHQHPADHIENRGSIWFVVSLGQETKHMAICSTINTNIINSIFNSILLN